MIGIGKFFCQCRKRLFQIGGWGRGLPALCLLEALAAFAYGQTTGGPPSDWSNLTPPPAAAETNTYQSDADLSNAPPADLTAAETTSEGPAEAGTNHLQAQLAMAGYYTKTRQPEKAE